MPSLCYNACMGRGSCRPPGVCDCIVPWTGYDCSVPRGDLGGFVYIHSPSADLGLREARKHGTRDALYSAEIVFLERLMVDWSLRTLDPRRALLYYVPTWLLSSFTNIVYEKGVSLYERLVGELQLHDAIFAASWRENRSRHVFFLAGDKGACLWPRGPIYMSHWGLTVPWKAMMLPQLWKSGALSSVRTTEPPCADERDIVVPPFVTRHRAPASAAAPTAEPTAATGRRPPPPPSARRLSSWACELMFAGAFYPEHKVAKSSWCDDGQHGGVKCYSQGVRAAVYAHHANRTGFCLAARLPSEVYTQSRFCLAPSGEGFGDRLSLSMLSGCVPLIIQPSVRQPLDDVLPYDEFSLRLGADAIPTLHERLARVTRPEHEKLREGVRRWARAFDWSGGSSDGLAYNFTRLALCQHAGLPSCTEYYPLSYGPAAAGEGGDRGGRRGGRHGGVHRPGDDPSKGMIDASLQRVKDGKVVPGTGR